MNQLLGHQILSSVKEYFSYRLLKDAAAYSNKTVTFYNYSDKVWTDKYVYGSPYAGFVYNSGVSGPTVCSGIYHPGFLPRSTGLHIDFRNGRIISDSALTGIITANVSIPDINAYVTTYSDYKLIAETNYLTWPNYQAATGYLSPNSHVLSSLFFRMGKTTNKTLAFGGQEWTIYNIKITAAMKDNYSLSAVADIIRDSQDRIFPIMTGTPLNEYNDLKSDWNYGNYMSNPPAYGLIYDSSFGHFENDVMATNNPTLEFGLGSVEVRVARNPQSLFP